MRSKLLGVVATAFVMGSMVGAPLASAHHDEDALTLYGKITDFEKTDTGDEGPSKGDELSVAYDLYSTDHEAAGDGDGTCEVVEFEEGDGGAHGHGYSASHEGANFEADCANVFRLDDGDIDVEGTITDEDFKAGALEFDIVGGSDEYSDAAGVAVIEFVRHHKSHSASHEDGASDDHGHDAPIFKVTFDFD